MRGAALAIGVLTSAPGAMAETLSPQIFGPHGCTIGAESIAALIEKGWPGAEIAAFAQEVVTLNEASQEGRWVVLGAELCTIELPDIPPGPQMSDPALAGLIQQKGVYAEQGLDGCFLAGFDRVMDALDDLGVADPTEAYLQFIGRGLLSVELRFYSEDILLTPPGFQVMVGDCSRAENADALAISHDALRDDFAEFVRNQSVDVVCGEPDLDAPAQQLRIAPEQSNAWLWFEWDLIARAAGWYDGVTESHRGTPRPPLCHFP